jgi:TonB-linked SusC/RagA family outer membrane protein
MRTRLPNGFLHFAAVIIFSLLCPATIFAAVQQTPKLQITGTVSDSAGVLSGVSVTIKETPGVGTYSDEYGKYILDVSKANSILVFSRVGYETQEIPVSGSRVIDVVMKHVVGDLNTVTVVAYGTQKKASVVSSITTINPEELKIPSSNLTASLAGRVAGIVAYQRTGEPGRDNADFFIRGVTTFGYSQRPLILIDGIESTSTDLARLQPDDIASFSLMKDAAAASMYGARGANGVLIITTKSGKQGKADVMVRFENSLSMNTSNVKLADPLSYMKLENEAYITRDRTAPLPYTQNEIDNTAAGVNAYVYPQVDWQKMLLKDYTNNQRLNMSMRGGGPAARYYLAGGVSRDNGILKVDKLNNFNNNIDLRNYQLRSNIDLDVTKTTLVRVLLSGSFDDYSGPIDGGRGTFNNIMHANPVKFPAYFPKEELPGVNHILFGNAEDGNYINPYARLVRGYKDYSQSTMGATFEIKQNLSFLIDGLRIRGLFNTQRYTYFDVSREYVPFYYAATGYDKPSNTYRLRLINEGQAREYLSYNEGPKNVQTTTYYEAAADYNKIISDRHEITNTLVYIRQNRLYANQGTLQKSLPYRNQGVSDRFSYMYDKRYIAEFSFGYNGSERFSDEKRYGFFPTGAVGWIVSNENFWQPFKNKVNLFKLRGSYGLIGNDNIGDANTRFYYLSEVDLDNQGRGSVFGENYGYYRNGVKINRYENRNITWERSLKLNAGIDLGLFNSLNIHGEYWKEHRYNILLTRASVPTTMGLTANIMANVGEAKSNGFEVSADYNKSFNKDIWLATRANFTYATNKFSKFEEPDYGLSYLSYVGKPINGIYGYLAEHLFVDDAEVRNSPKQYFGEYGAGDIKYKDINGDGQITFLDRVLLGYPSSPEIVYGFGFSFGVKQFDISAFFQGLAHESFMMDVAGTTPFANQTQLLKAYADDHWSEDNRNSYALWPRLAPQVVNNNAQPSTWWLRRGDFLRLKTVEIGYEVPKGILSKIHLKSLRLYVSANNPVIWSKFKLWDAEMGSNGLDYPIQKVYNGGILLNF